MKITRTAVILATGLTLAGQSMADEVYRARLSAQDHVNSAGDKLTTAAAVLRQDRAIWHSIGGADGEDQADEYFSKKSTRENYENLLKTGMIGEAEQKAILNGTPLVEVTITYDESMKQNFVAVKVLKNDAAPANKAAKPAKVAPEKKPARIDGAMTEAKALAQIRKAGFLGDNERVISVEHLADQGIWVVNAAVEGDPNVKYKVNEADGIVSRGTP